MTGSTVGHYRVLNKLGEGGMGVVYAAVDERLGRKVALKFCCSAQDPQMRRALLDEARSAAHLNHPNIAQVYDIGQTDSGEPFVAMELVPGPSLADRLRHGPIAPDETLSIVSGIASALTEAHAHGVIHRDLKPSNIRFTATDGVKVVDFGLATAPLAETVTACAPATAVTATITGVIRGTPMYMSPEQAVGAPADPRSDLFAVGAVMYECLAGKPPFAAATSSEILKKVISHHPPAPCGDARINRVVSRLLEKRPQDRYASARDLLADVRREPPERQPRKSRTVAMALIAFFAVAVAAAWFLFSREASTVAAANRWYEQGMAAQADGTWHKASKLLERAIEIDPSFVLARARLAQTLDELGYEARAKKETLQLTRPGGAAPNLSEADLLQVQAIHAYIAGERERSVDFLRRRIPKVSSKEKLHTMLDLGRVLTRVDKVKEALAAYEEATRLDPQSAAAYLGLGGLYARMREPEKAEAALVKAENLYNLTSNTEGVAECLYTRARLATTPAAALGILDKALAPAEIARNEQQVVKIHLLASNRHLRMGDKQKAIARARAALDLAERSGLENMTTRALIDLGNALGADGGRDHFEKALEIARRTGQLSVAARAQANLADLLLDQGEVTLAANHINDALSFYKAGNYSDETNATLVALARVKIRSGDFDGATADLNSAMRGAVPKTFLLGVLQETMGRVLEARERYPAALTAFLDAMHTFEAARSKPGFANAAADAATVAALLGRRREAEQLLTKAERAGHPRLSARAVIALTSGRYEAAAEYAAKAAGGSHDKRGIALSHTIRCLALARMGRFSEAATAAQRAVDLAASAGDRNLEIAAALARAEAQADRRAGGAALARFSADLQRIDKPESGWRVAALGSDGGAEFRKFVSSWDKADLLSYRSRPDLQHLFRADRSRREKLP